MKVKTTRDITDKFCMCHIAILSNWRPGSQPATVITFDYASSLKVISKKYFHPGGIALSEWMRSVRAVRDTPVADYSAPSLNTTRRVAYRPPIAVLLFLLALSVSDSKRTLWRWRPIVTIRRNKFIGHALASGLQCDGWRCENHSTRSFYQPAKYNSLFSNYTHHSKLPDLCG